MCLILFSFQHTFIEFWRHSVYWIVTVPCLTNTGFKTHAKYKHNTIHLNFNDRQV